MSLNEDQLRAEIVELDDVARDREFSDAERQQWNQQNERLEELQKRRARVAELGSRPGALVHGADDMKTGWNRVDDGGVFSEVRNLRAQALTCNERASRMPDGAREHMARTLEADDDPEQRMARFVTVTSSDEYFRAFRKWLNNPQSGHYEWTPAEREAWQGVKRLERAMGIGTVGAGGALVPYELDPQILISGVGSVNPMREACRVETTMYNTKKFVTGAQVAAHWYNEAAEVSDDTPALLQPSIDCRKAMTFVPISFELWEDSDISQQIGALFADAKAQLESTAFTLGDGNPPNPKGIITAVSAVAGSVITTATNVLAQGDLYANQAALPPRWRTNGKWMMNLSILNGFRQLPQATGLNYSVIDDSGPRPKALGWEIYENSAMDGTLTASAADYLVLSGDFNQFVIVDRIGTSIETVPILVGPSNRFPTGQRGVLMHWRTGSDVLIADAFRLSNYSA
jgi:HK97 family phage major capsid protein